ncbi:MAG TPA: serine hydrolase domain-containing protein [Candidatus Limnocylindrales bacterium]|nr:serine hydrolase domain-containing protein [Candidatus Limnocylindrales bacterium]
MTLTAAFPEIDELFDRYHATAVAPGVAFGVIVDGELVHAGGRGTLRAGDGPDGGTPGIDSRYRIASMTKSFTAAAVLRLRDDGILRLDDPVTTLVPELAGLRGWSADSPPITIRSLLTMTAGFPTDDPWGDRQLGLDHEAFLRFLERGPALAWPPGVHFEYANLGYAILGLVVSRAAGEPYRAFVERRILEPLGMTATTFDVDGVEPEVVAPGYVKREDRWVEEPMAPDGAFAPMGGLFSTVRDLATWVRVFAAASPPRDEPDDGVPLTRATLREMQELQRAIPPELRGTRAGAPPAPFVSGYGFGLFVSLDVVRGRIVSHSGGLPGYGSNMRWHPATGLGVVAVANGRYAQPASVCSDALNLLIDRGRAAPRRPSPWPATLAAKAVVERLVDAWDDEVAGELFAMNVALDEDLASRRAAMERLHETHGRLRPDPSADAVSDTPAHLRWWLTGDRGRVEVEILLGPERPPRVQWLELTSVPEPSAALAEVARRVVGRFDERPPSWPTDVPLAPGVDRDALDRDLRGAEAVFGPLRLGPVTAGDGGRKATWRLDGPHGTLSLALELAEDEATVEAVTLVPDTVESPIHLA